MIGQLLAVGGDRETLARLGGRLGSEAREAADEYAGMTAGEQRDTRAKLAAAARVPVPPGIRGVHGSWIEAGLVGLPPRARAALAGGALDPVDVWLVRTACAELPPLPAVEPELRAAGSLDEALRMSGDALARWLAEVGADQLAFALRKAGIAAITAVASRLIGERLVAAAARIDGYVDQLGPMRAAIARCRGAQRVVVRSRPDSGDSTLLARADELAATQMRAGIADDHLLVRVGARAIAPRVDALARRQLCVRLPRPLGLVVRDELTAHASTAIDQGPGWGALKAAHPE